MVTVNHGLRFVWWEAVDDGDVAKWWGKLAGTANRFRVIADELTATRERKDLTRAFHELGYHLENYFVRVHELRERAVSLAEAITGSSLNGVRSRALRHQTLHAIDRKYSRMAAPLKELLAALDDDMKSRSEHTHKQFLSLQLATASDKVYDLESVFLHTIDKVQDKSVKKFLRAEVDRLATLYAEKAGSISTAAWHLLDASDKFVPA